MDRFKVKAICVPESLKNLENFGFLNKTEVICLLKKSIFTAYNCQIETLEQGGKVLTSNHIRKDEKTQFKKMRCLGCYMFLQFLLNKPHIPPQRSKATLETKNRIAFKITWNCCVTFAEQTIRAPSQETFSLLYKPL